MCKVLVKTYLKGSPGAFIKWQEHENYIDNVYSIIFNDNKDHAKLVFLNLSDKQRDEKLILNNLNVKPFQQN